MRPLPGIEIRHLVALASVARARSFRAAAHSLGYVQSALSQQLAELEEIVGARLVQRSRGKTGVRLTDAGRLLLEHADLILARVRAAGADLAAMAAHQPLRVGAQEAVAANLMPAVLNAWGHDAGREISVTGEPETDLFHGVEAGELEYAFVDLPLLPGPFDWVELLVDPCVLLLQAESPLAARSQPPGLAEIAELPLVGRDGSRLQARIEASLRAHGRRPEVVQRAGSDAAVRALVAAGVGVAIVPRLSLDSADSRTAAVDLTGVIAPRILVLIWHRERRLSPVAVRFRQATEDVCAGLSRGNAGNADR